MSQGGMRTSRAGDGNGNCTVRVGVAKKRRSLLRTRGDSLISACALVTILAGIIVSDIRLHDQMTRRMKGVSFDLVGASVRLQGATADMAATAQASSLEFAHMWTFVAVAVVLTIWMFRT
jgi:hypothetical protein